MNTDAQFHELFSINPEWLFELIGRPSPGRSQMQSVALKAISRTTDGLFVPDDISKPLTIAEWQFYLDRTIYARTAIAMAMVQLENPDREVEGVILFGSPSHDPQISPWNRVIDCCHLEEAVNRLEQSDPDHPLPAVFKPLIVSDDALLERDAVSYLRRIRNSSVDPPAKATLEDVFVSWFEQRFKDKTKQEIEAMFQQELPDLRDTRSGQQIFEIGREEGIEVGREEGLEKGRVEESRAAVRRLAEKKFGELPADVLSRIQAISDIAVLHNLQLDIFDAVSLDDLF